MLLTDDHYSNSHFDGYLICKTNLHYHCVMEQVLLVHAVKGHTLILQLCLSIMTNLLLNTSFVFT